ncbi:Neprilysin-2, partial [Fragariocoptes setiger]
MALSRCWMIVSVILASVGTASLLLSLMISHTGTAVFSQRSSSGLDSSRLWQLGASTMGRDRKPGASSVLESKEFDTSDDTESLSAIVRKSNNRHNHRDKDDDDDDDDDSEQIVGSITPIENENNALDVGGNQRHKDICLTESCIKSAAQILNNINPAIDPCEDFYLYACGGWIKQQVIPDEKTSVSVFSLNQNDLNTKLRILIERAPKSNEPPIVNQMRNVYKSCTNLGAIESLDTKPLLEELRYLGGYPAIEASSGGSHEQYADWIGTILKFRERGFSHDILIDLSVVPDVENNTRFVIDLDQSSLGLPERSYFMKGFNDTTVAAYYQLMIESAWLLGAPRDDTTRQAMLDVLNFETNLAKLSLPREQRRNASRLYNKFKKSELYDLAPHIDWTRYLDGLLKDHVGDNEDIIVKVPSFLTGIDKVLQAVNAETLQNYLMWRVVSQSMPLMSRKWRELAQTYTNVTTGRQREEPRWEQCLGPLTGTLGTALSALYARNHFKKESKARAMEMVDYIRKEFIKMLKEIDWMDDETRVEAEKKANAITAYIGYPDELLDDDKVEELYQGLSLTPHNYYGNIRAMRVWSTNYAFNNLRKPNLRGDWKKHARAAVVNAFYNSLENSIDFPAAILQGLFFDANRPNYLNYGAIGFIIGHEITHGFDDRGRQFDKNGNKRNWWRPETDLRFRERAQCIVEQYSNFTIPENGLKVNGITTQGENIADNGGLKEAFRAYKRWVKDNGPEQRLPGLELNPTQLFWVSAANIWCGKFRPEVLKLRVTSGVHSPAQFRIQGTLSNLPQFAESFNCKLGTPMNPVKKCSVW